MITLEELNIWQQRWASLNETLSALETNYRDQKLVFPRRQTLYHLVKNLKSFAEEQFNFFLKGFSPGGNFLPEQPPSDPREPFPKYPPEYALGTILDQVGFDLEIFQRVEQQRRSLNASVLDRADKLAQKALQPVVGPDKFIKDSDTTVLTYFQKSASIRIIPYAPVALIGVPFTATTIPRDFLAIPHEVGHYVYRNGKWDGSKSIPDELDLQLEETSPAYIKKWVEEIFADVYGCLIGGPVIALDFQDLQLVKDGIGFTEDDADHPIPFIRPYVYTYVLEKMTNFAQSVLKLNNHWETKLTKRDNPDTFTTASGSQSNLEAARGKMGTVIDIIFAKLSNELTERWSANLATAERVEKLYEKFTIAHIDALIAGVEVEDLALVETRSTGGATQEPEIPFEDWVKRIDVDGWNTQGPQSRN